MNHERKRSISQLAKKAFKERENWYLKDIVDLEEKLSSHDRIVYKMGYQNPELDLKKSHCMHNLNFIIADIRLHSDNLIINSHDLEETLEDAK
ncbi:hypothetical protein Tco_1055225 [Tanacetum coccineum]|uniref:Uncharacterized protein n=1 Tax=Tanacetum coccineum TaxID=301880 RepID=A0ABQ5GZ03_9ASTR